MVDEASYSPEKDRTVEVELLHERDVPGALQTNP